MTELHRQLSVILRVISSSEKVHLEIYRDLCLQFSLNVANNFPWARLNHTLHGTVHQTAEFIERNDGVGLGMRSEEGLEANM